MCVADASSAWLWSRAHHFGDAYEFVAFSRVARQQSINGCDRCRTICTESRVTAVVQQNDVATSYLGNNFLLNKFRRWRLPVVSGYVPHHRLKTQLPNDSEHSRPTSSP